MSKKKQTPDNNHCLSIDAEQMAKELQATVQNKTEKDTSVKQLELTKQQCDYRHAKEHLAQEQTFQNDMAPINLKQAQLQQEAAIKTSNLAPALAESNERIHYIQLKGAQVRDYYQRSRQTATLWLQRYKLVTGVLRPVNRPDSKRWHIAVALSFVVVESLANGYFLGQALVGGPLAGIVQASSIAGLSVALSWLAGVYLVRGLFHHERSVQCTCGVLLVLFVAFMVAYHLQVAHLRIALQQVMDSGQDTYQAYRLAVLRLLEVPFQISNFDSEMLLLLGLTFSLLALLAGTTSDDLKPDYGKHDAQARQAERESHRWGMQQIDDFRGVTDPLEELAHDEVEEQRSIAGAFLHCQLQKKMRMDAYTITMTALNCSADHINNVYRSLNPASDDSQATHFDSAALQTEQARFEQNTAWYTAFLASIKQAGVEVEEFQVKLSEMRQDAIGLVQQQQQEGQTVVYRN